MSIQTIFLGIFVLFAAPFVHAADNNRVKVTSNNRRVLEIYGPDIYHAYLAYKRNLYQQNPEETHEGHTVMISKRDNGEVYFQGHVAKKNTAKK